MNAPADLAAVIASQPHATLGYKAFTLGSFRFRRDEYFAHIEWTTRDGRPLSHTMDAGNFLRALMRDVAWGFFYGWVNFDHVIGTVNHYQTVDFYRRQLQRDDEGGRCRPAGELRQPADRRDLQGDARRLDQRGLRPLRRTAGDRLGLRPQARPQHVRRSPGRASWPPAA